MASVLQLYKETGSWAEQVDARAKIIASVALIAVVLISSNLYVKAAISLVLVVVWLSARLSAKLLLGTLGSLGFLFFGTFLLRAVIAPAHSGGAATDLFGLTVSHAGTRDAATMIFQIITVVLALTLLVRTTAPTVLSEGAEILLTPLKRLGVPIHEAVIMFSIALRFLPILVQEFYKLQLAQFARGAALTQGGILSRVKAIFPLLMPLLIVTLTRAKELSEAMDARGYAGGEGRTSIREYRYQRLDFSVLASVAAIAVGAVVVSILELLG